MTLILESEDDFQKGLALKTCLRGFKNMPQHNVSADMTRLVSSLPGALDGFGQSSIHRIR